MSESKISEKEMFTKAGESEITGNKEAVSITANKIDMVIDAECDYIIRMIESFNKYSDMAAAVAENIKALAELLQVNESIRTLTEILPKGRGKKGINNPAAKLR